MVKRKQTTKEITKALEEGGMTTTADNFEATVTAGLFRASKKFGEIVKVKGSWGLAEWYKGMRVGPQESKVPAKKKAKPKAKLKSAPVNAKPQPKVVPAQTPPPPEQGDQAAIEAYFGGRPDDELIVKEIAAALGIRVQTVALICSKLAHHGGIEKTHTGKFRLAKVHAMPKAG